MVLRSENLFPTETVAKLITKVKGHSVLAKLSAQTPVPFNGKEQFIFNLEGNAQIVGEGEKKGAGEAKLTSKVIKPLKFVYQARISDEFKYATDEKKINYLEAFIDGFSKKIAEAFDIAAIHGLEPKTLTDASFKATNSFDGVITGNIVTYNETTIDENIEAAIQMIRAKGGDVTGLALSPVAGSALGKLKDANRTHIFPEFRFGQNPNSFFGMASDINKTMTVQGGSADTDHVIAGDFENMFKWGYAEEMPMEIIEFGDPDGTGRDLKAYNEICLRVEAYIGWGILDVDSFARVKVGG